MNKKIRFIAHRGASKYAPENTMSAFKLALEFGASCIECDVAFSADNIPFIFHDDYLDRTSNGKGPISSASWSDLRQLDVGSWFSNNYREEKILSLDELIKWHSKQSIMLNLEIKSMPNELIKERMDLILDSIQSHKNIILSSFQVEILDYLNQINNQIPRALLVNYWSSKHIEWAKKLTCFQLNIADRLVSKNRIQKIHEVGLKVGVYTVNQFKRVKKLEEYGVDYVFTDDLSMEKHIERV
jgi:glycerophosphoryl diester phosphodiesterase